TAQGRWLGPTNGRAPAIGNAIFAGTGARPRPGQCAAGARAKGVIGGSYFRSSSTTTGSGLGQYAFVPHRLEVLMSQLLFSRYPADVVEHGKLGAHLALLMPPLAALLYPFLLAAFHVNIAPVISGQSAEPALQSAAATLFLLLAFAAPIVALLGAMTLGELAAHIDSDWAFATGAPPGLIKEAWNIRLVPHYGLAVFFVLSHLAAGGRSVLLAHGVARRFADRFLIASATAAGLVAFVIMLGMCGARLSFAIP